MKPLHLNKEWLHQKYEIEKLSTYDIAKIVDRDPKSVYNKLRDFGIKTRPRGQNLSDGDYYLNLPGSVHPLLGTHRTNATKLKISIAHSVPKPYLRGKNNGMFGRTGKSHPNYKGGCTPERQRLYGTQEWKTLVKSVYARDNFCCLRCSVTRKLHAHHIKSWAVHPALRFELSNLVTLCRKCHEWVHSKQNILHEFIQS